jgi:NADH:ubiquinone oxidoreductase subunit 5 (subunit L)/multisubunit Na+/H+ antiporter MnhA subunit
MEPLALLSSWIIIISSALALSTLDLKNLVALSTLRQLRLIFLLITLGLPSLALLYSIDETALPYLTFRVIGHQWY